VRHPREVFIRARRDADADALLRIAERAHTVDGYPPYLPNGDFRDFLFAHETLGAWVVEVEGEPVGQVALHLRTSGTAMAKAAEALQAQVEQLGVVARLVVSPNHRHRGAGRALLETAARAAFNRGLFPVLDVATHLDAAVGLYERCGWIRVGEVEVAFTTGETLKEFVYLAPTSLRPTAAVKRSNGPSFHISVDDPRAHDVQALLANHLAFSRGVTPAEYSFALDVGQLVDQNVTLFSARDAGRLVGVAALKRLDDATAELKSMHTLEAERRRGVGHALVEHILAFARAHGYGRVSLETGSTDDFVAARSLYAGLGFRPCEPFGEYRESPYNTFMTLTLDASQTRGTT
jgi:putative acetyltransferase